MIVIPGVWERSCPLTYAEKHKLYCEEHLKRYGIPESKRFMIFDEFNEEKRSVCWDVYRDIFKRNHGYYPEVERWVLRHRDRRGRLHSRREARKKRKDKLRAERRRNRPPTLGEWEAILAVRYAKARGYEIPTTWDGIVRYAAKCRE